MNGYDELRLTLLVLREHLTDPDRLAQVGADWSPNDHTSFLRFLVDNGVLSPGHLRAPEAADPVTRTFVGGPSRAAGSTARNESATVVGSTASVQPADATRGWSEEESPAERGDPPPIAGGRYHIRCLHQA